MHGKQGDTTATRESATFAAAGQCLCRLGLEANKGELQQINPKMKQKGKAKTI